MLQHVAEELGTPPAVAPRGRGRPRKDAPPQPAGKEPPAVATRGCGRPRKVPQSIMEEPEALVATNPHPRGGPREVQPLQAVSTLSSYISFRVSH